MSTEYEVEFHAGDAFPIKFDYAINDVPIEELEIDEIEFCFGTHRFLKSTGDIYLDDETGKYVMWLTQEATWGEYGGGGIGEWTVRFRIGNNVVADDVQEVRVGRGLSMEVI